MGPLITDEHRQRVLQCIEQTRASGAQVRFGGSAPAGKGYFVTPTVLAGVKPGMQAFDQEIFGPVMAVSSFATVEEAVALANQCDYGLAAYAFTESLARSRAMAEALDAGMIAINSWRPHGTEIPFPPRKDSGYGHTCGHEGMMEFLDTKVVSIES